MRADRTFWFPAKRHGWGWGPPIAWQGWAVLAVFVAALVGEAILFPPPRALGAYFACVALSSLVLLVVCRLKAEPPRWRWGGK